MALSKEIERMCMRRLLLARMRILNTHGFYGSLLMHMHYALEEPLEGDEDPLETAATDGTRIIFNPHFLQSLSESELDFVLMHEILHVVLEHCIREDGRDHDRFNIACDIVVNSNILLENKMDLNSITLKEWGESMHLAPDGKEGYEYTAEQVYEMLPKMRGKGRAKGGRNSRGNQTSRKDGPRWDNHARWGQYGRSDALRDFWVVRFSDACETVSIREKSGLCGSLPLFAKRLLGQLREPQSDWRTILNEFVQMEINDYSFSPPDRRFHDLPFFLPAFNALDNGGHPFGILFMIDTSGSMTDEEITAAFSEINGAIEQFGGKLQGWLGFFDAAIVEPQPFEDVDDVMKIRPVGGGGTDFHIIFEYVRKFMADNPPSCIVILTDGYANFPEENAAQGIPVLWLINNEHITPPWGKVARIQV